MKYLKYFLIGTLLFSIVFFVFDLFTYPKDTFLLEMGYYNTLSVSILYLMNFMNLLLALIFLILLLIRRTLKKAINLEKYLGSYFFLLGANLGIFIGIILADFVR